MSNNKDNSLKDVVPEESGVTVHICGPSSEGCVCRCPDECGHVWDGPWVVEKLAGGGGMGTTTCSKCGMRRIDHDIWVMP